MFDRDLPMKSSLNSLFQRGEGWHLLSMLQQINVDIEVSEEVEQVLVMNRKG
jgi:hypothetical protein